MRTKLPNDDSPVYLWSFQPKWVCDYLQANGQFYSSWEQISPLWQVAYRTIMYEMQQKGFNISEHPPFWAWYMGGNHQYTPQIDDALNLLGSEERIAYEQTQIIEFYAPKSQVFLSNYHYFNKIIEFAFQNRAPTMKDRRRLLKIKTLSEYDSIQATLPYMDLEWVTKIQPLILPDEVD